jgi:hypothetical protein
MMVACICSTKNEGDIIEAFVRLNSRFCNTFYFVDESSDNTRQIISLLRDEGYDVGFLAPTAGGYNQPHPTKTYIDCVKKILDPDWIFLLDADEIIVAPDHQRFLNELREIPENTFLAAEWKTYLPTTLHYFESTSPLNACFVPRRNAEPEYRKIAIPRSLSDKIITTPGNHSARSLDGTPLQEQAAASYFLAHFPVRSVEQIIVKNIIATHNLTTRLDTQVGEGFHVFQVFEMIRDRNYQLTLEDLIVIASNYACQNQITSAEIFNVPNPVVPDLLKTELRYLSLAKINVIARLDSEIERLSKQIRRKKEGFPEFKARLENFYLQVHRPPEKGRL